MGSKPISNPLSVAGKLAAMGAAGVLGAIGAKFLGRFIVNKVHDDFLKILTSDLYNENIWEAVSSTMRIGPQVVLETELRSDRGKLVERPMGPVNQFPSLDDLKFNFAQINTLPTEVDTEIDFSVTIGKYAKKPLRLNQFLMLAPMAYGVALSKPVKIALAKACSAAGVAYHTGGGAPLMEIIDYADKVIFQYGRGNWPIPQEVLLKCHAVEIQLGQGAYGGVGFLMRSNEVNEQLRKAFNIPKGQDLITRSRQPEVQSPEDLKKLVDKLRNITDGVPIGVKIAAGKYLEADLFWICNSGADFVVVDGAEAATKGSPPILQDDFGVPTVFAVDRAAKWMEKHGFKDRVSLIACGRIRTPGDALKVKALGADACQVGSIALVALSHNQVHKPLPFEPPTSLAWYGEAYADQFDIETGARSLQNFFESCKLEMAEGIRALGKTSLSQVCRDDLMTTNEMYARALNIPMVYDAFDPMAVQPQKIKRLKL
ncbi:MAG TPA: FMN-binding glutamate synthase family protein [Clostridiales bacterium]|nr:FMN-binding glutamate synthase family protein [Clostridiales bacterium]